MKLQVFIAMALVTNAASIDVFNMTADELDASVEKYPVLTVAYCDTTDIEGLDIPENETWNPCTFFHEELTFAARQAEEDGTFRDQGEIGFAMVDMGLDENEVLKDKFGGLVLYPALEVFHKGTSSMHGIATDYRYAQYLLHPIKKAIAPDSMALYVNTYEEIQTAIGSHTEIVVGFFDKDSEEHNTFQKVCSEDSIIHVKCLWSDAEEMAIFLRKQKPAVVALRYAQFPPFVFELDDNYIGDYSNSKLFMEQAPAAMFAKGTSFRYTGHPRYPFRVSKGPMSDAEFFHYHFVNGMDKRESCGYKKSLPCREPTRQERDVDAAAISASSVDVDHNTVYLENTTSLEPQEKQIVEWFGITKEMLPCSLILGRDVGGEAFPRNLRPTHQYLATNVTARDKIEMQEAVFAGNAARYMLVRSEPASCTEGGEEHNTLVGDSFEEEVLHQEKDTLLVIYDEAHYNQSFSEEDDGAVMNPVKRHIAAMQAAGAELKGLGVDTVNFHAINTKNDIPHLNLPLDFGPSHTQLQDWEGEWAISALFLANQTNARPFVFIHTEIERFQGFFKTKWDILNLLHCFAHHRHRAFSQTCLCTDDVPPWEGPCDSKDTCAEVPMSADMCDDVQKHERAHRSHVLELEEWEINHYAKRKATKKEQAKAAAQKPKVYAPRKPNPIAEMQADVADRFKETKNALDDELNAMNIKQKSAEDVVAELSQGDFDEL